MRSVKKPEGMQATERPAIKAMVLGRQWAGEAGAKASGDQRRLAVGPATPIARGPAGVLSVIGADERTRIVTTELAPYVLICALEITAPWGDFVGTGWFVGPKTLITAGHCVYHPTQMGGWAQSIRIIPGADGDETPLGAIVATRFETTDAWEQHQNPDFDMAAIHLDEAILPERFTPFRVGVLPDDRLLSHSVNVSGYPGDKGGKEQWWARNGIRAVRPLRIFYDVDTMGGQSGAPAFIIERVGEAPLVVGIHAYGVGGTPNEVPMEVNSAPRVTADVLKLIQGWVEEDTPGFAVLT